jgi:hypothetical protein
MQRNIFVLLITVILFAAGGCKKTYDYSLDQAVSPVANLFAPQDSFFVKLQPSSGASLAFQWSTAQAADGSLVQYVIAFDTAGDNFKHPVFEIASDGTGVNTTATLTHSQLNQIANLAGIPSLGTGNLYWTVFATKGLSLVQAKQTRVITVQRPAGFANVPADLYLTGAATEAGTDLSKAIHFKQTASGVFELYTGLKGGTYQFVDRNSGTPTTFYVSGQNLQQGGSTTYSDTAAQVRFNLDFNNAVATITVIRSVDVWYAINDQAQYHLSYSSNSTWVDAGQLIQEPVESWGSEERYKFRFTVNDGGGVADSYEWYGSSNGDNNEPTSTSPASYFYLVPVTSDQFSNCYKFSTPTEDNVNNTITVYMQPDAPYTHTVVPQ